MLKLKKAIFDDLKAIIKKNLVLATSTKPKVSWKDDIIVSDDTTKTKELKTFKFTKDVTVKATCKDLPFLFF